jgi:hypothetical protein
MLVVKPIKCELNTAAATVEYLYPEWQSGTYYSALSRVRIWDRTRYLDYEAKLSHVATNTTTPLYSNIYWRYLSVSAGIHAPTHSTNCAVSLYPAWVSGSSVSAGQAVYDRTSRSDFLANVDITGANNTSPPSSAINSSSEEIANRWTSLGSSNAHAFLDYEVSTVLTGIDNSGAPVSPTVVLNTSEEGIIDRVCFSSLSNVASVTIKTYVNNVLTHTANHSFQTSSGTYATSATVAITPVQSGASCNLDISTTRVDSSKIAYIGAIVVGKAKFLAFTEWNVQTSIMSFSKKERDSVFGTTRFIKRGSAKTIKATCFVDPKYLTGDQLQLALAELDGMPVYWDLNNELHGEASSYDRFRILGYYSNFSIVIAASSFESMSIDIEGVLK